MITKFFELSHKHPTVFTLVVLSLSIVGIEVLSEILEALGMFKGVTGTQLSFGDRANG